MRRTGRLEAPSMPVSSSALSALPSRVLAHADEDVAQRPTYRLIQIKDAPHRSCD
jgi:hypothetical protein